MKILQNLAGMSEMTEQIITADLLQDAKTAVRNYAIAITEASTPEVRKVLRSHLNEAVDIQEMILRYMTVKKRTELQ